MGYDFIQKDQRRKAVTLLLDQPRMGQNQANEERFLLTRRTLTRRCGFGSMSDNEVGAVRAFKGPPGRPVALS